MSLRANCRPTRWSYLGGRNHEPVAVITEVGYNAAAEQADEYEVHTTDGEPICKTKTIVSAARVARDYASALESWQLAHPHKGNDRDERPEAWAMVQAYRVAVAQHRANR